MLSEDGLLLVGVLGACGLVVLGALELVWPTRPRRPQRRRFASRDRAVRAPARAAPAARPIPVVSPTRSTVDTSAAVPLVPPVPIDTVPAVSPIRPAPIEIPPAVVAIAPVPIATAPVDSLIPPGPEIPPAVVPIPPELNDTPPDVSPIPSVLVATAVSPVPPVAVATAPAVSPVRSGVVVAPPIAPVVTGAGAAVDRGFALVHSGKFGEAVTHAQHALLTMKSSGTAVPTADAARQRARLWGVVGLGHQGLDEVEDARFAFEEAVALAPADDRARWEGHLAALALAVGRGSLGSVGGVVTTAPAERVASLESAIEWLDRGLAVAPDHAELRTTRAAAHEALWATHETALQDLLRRREYDRARRLLVEVTSDPECPAERRPALRQLLARALSGDARQAIATALRHGRHGRLDEALTALVSAENRVATMPAAAAADGREPLARRVWRGYVKLADLGLKAGAGESALPPLYRALALANGDGERGFQTRATLKRALAAIVDARAADIGRLIDAGDANVAQIHVEKLWSLLRGAVDQGLPQDDLSETFSAVLALFDRMNAPRPALEAAH